MGSYPIYENESEEGLPLGSGLVSGAVTYYLAYITMRDYGVLWSIRLMGLIWVLDVIFLVTRI